MSFRQFIILRRLSTSRTLRNPSLSAEYKSKQLWDRRFNCELLNDVNVLKNVNAKIINGVELDNLELDIFINVAAPRVDDIVHLQESTNLVRKFRKTLYCNHILNSTSHALCRLFLDSERLPSLINVLENRVEYGIFPDFFILNLLFNKALEQNDFSLAARLAALVMLQEEFGINKLTDALALYSVSRYIESQTDFTDWNKLEATTDSALQIPVDEALLFGLEKEEEAKKEDTSKSKEADDDDDEEEDDAEYIRIPFLRNPYFDDHFDLTNPRGICGKTLSQIGIMAINDNAHLAQQCQFMGAILHGKWTKAVELLKDAHESRVPIVKKDVVNFYLDNLHDVEGPSEDIKQTIVTKLENLPEPSSSISQQAKERFESLKRLESEDIENFKQDLANWTKLRFQVKRANDEIESRRQLIQEINRKKEELKHKEQYLYFFDELKKKKLTRIDYD